MEEARLVKHGRQRSTEQADLQTDRQKGTSVYRYFKAELLTCQFNYISPNHNKSCLCAPSIQSRMRSYWKVIYTSINKRLTLKATADVCSDTTLTVYSRYTNIELCAESTHQSLTSERWVDEVLPVGTEQSVAKHQVQTAEQQVVRVHQVITDHTEVTFTVTSHITQG